MTRGDHWHCVMIIIVMISYVALAARCASKHSGIIDRLRRYCIVFFPPLSNTFFTSEQIFFLSHSIIFSIIKDMACGESYSSALSIKKKSS